MKATFEVRELKIKIFKEEIKIQQEQILTTNDGIDKIAQSF